MYWPESVLKNEMQKYDWLGKVIHCELCKIFKFDHTTKWRMYWPESVLKNEMQKYDWLGKVIH